MAELGFFPLELPEKNVKQLYDERSKSLILMKHGLPLTSHYKLCTFTLFSQEQFSVLHFKVSKVLSLLLLAVTDDSKESWQERHQCDETFLFFRFTLPTAFSASAAKTQDKAVLRNQKTNLRLLYALEGSVSDWSEGQRGRAEGGAGSEFYLL